MPITPDEAIGMLDAKRMDDDERGAKYSADACRVGAEAIQRLKKLRAMGYAAAQPLLPTEKPTKQKGGLINECANRNRRCR